MITFQVPSGIKLLDADIKIINELFQNPCLKICELSKRTNVNRLTITSHLKTLMESGVIIRKAGLSLKKMGYVTAVVGLEVRNKKRLAVEESLKTCPTLEHLYRTSGKANIHLQVWDKDYQSLNSNIDSIRSLDGVELVYYNYLGTPVFGDFAVNPSMDRMYETYPSDPLVMFNEINNRT